MPASSTRYKFAYFLGFLGVLGFGATLPVTRLALVDFSPGFLTFARAVVAALIAVLALKMAGKRWQHANDWLIFIAGILLIFAFPGFMAIAMQTVPASHGGVVLGFLPLATAVFARLIAQERPSGPFWILSITGCVVVITFTALKTDDLGHSGISSGDLWLVAAGISASAGYVLFGKLSRHTAGWEIISRSLVLNIPLILAGTWWFYKPEFADAGHISIIALLYLGSVSMFLAFCAWNVAMAIGGIARIGQLQLLQTFVTLAVSALLLSEKIDMVTLATAAIVTAIIALSRKN